MFGISKTINIARNGARKTQEAYNSFVGIMSKIAIAAIAIIVVNGITSTFWGLQQVVPNITVTVWIIGVLLITALVGVLALLHKQTTLANAFRVQAEEREESYKRQIDKLQRTTHTGNEDFSLQKDIISNKYDLILHPGGAEEIVRLNDVQDIDIAIAWEQNRLTHVLAPDMTMKSINLMLAVFQSYDLKQTKLLALNLHEKIKNRELKKLKDLQGGEDDVYEHGEVNFVPADTSKVR